MRKCPECGTGMLHHEWGHKVYWTCPECGKELVTSKTAEIMYGTVG